MASRPAPGPKSSALTRAEPCAASAAPVCFWVAVDHSSVRPSPSAVASVVPFPLNDKAATAAPVAMVAPGWLCVAVSQSLTSPSSPPAARTFPPGPNASALIAAGPAVIVFPSGLEATAVTWPERADRMPRTGWASDSSRLLAMAAIG